MNKIEECIRQYTRGDEEHIIRLHNDIFHSSLDTSRWNWQFINGHPKGHSWITLAQSGTEIVGQYCSMRHHLNLNGREIVAGQSCDTMVRSDHRGKNWFTKLATTNYETAKEDGSRCVFGFPNRNSYPGFMKHLSWIRLFRLNYYYCRLGYRRVVGMPADIILRYFIKIKHHVNRQVYIFRGIRDYEITTTEILPLDIDDILRQEFKR